MGSRAGDADGDRRVLGDAACGDRGGGRASGSATAWAMRKEMSRLSSGVFFGFGCFTGSGVLRPMAASRAAARHRQPRAALATNSQRCRVGRVREALREETIARTLRDAAEDRRGCAVQPGACPRVTQQKGPNRLRTRSLPHVLRGVPN